MVLNIRHNVVSQAYSGVGMGEPPPGAGVTGLSRTAYTGSNPVTVNGTTITRRNFTGTLYVRANNVTVSDCHFNLDTSSFAWGIDADDTPVFSGLVVDHCTFIGSGSGSANSCVLTGENWTVTNCSMSGNYDNGIMVQGGTGLCTGNTIRGLHPGSIGSAHVDGIQIAGSCDGVHIAGNWVESWDTSCIIIKADFGDINDVTVTGNTLINTPGKQTAFCMYTVPVGANSVSDITITNNRMEEGFGGYLADSGATGLTTSGNVDYVTGASIEPL
jgi:hypothetical protein